MDWSFRRLPGEGIIPAPTPETGMPYVTPRDSFDTIMTLGTAHLERVVAIDSQSDERSESIPSTPGQITIVQNLQVFFRELGLVGELDGSHNLVVDIPASPGFESHPPLALMVHIDTARGSIAVPKLDCVPAWDGGPIRFRENDRLVVAADKYASTLPFVGEDVLHGPGQRAFGLDDKLGTAEVMTLAVLLVRNPEIPHGPLCLVFRPDEEIGRMAAVVGLAETLHGRGVRYGYTVDGILPFEVNVSNFNASHARVAIAEDPSTERTFARSLALRVDGAKSHGATAKAEGYLNATTLIGRTLERLGDRADIGLVSFQTDELGETSADVVIGIADEPAGAAFVGALQAETGPHAWRGAGVTTHAGAEPIRAGGALAQAFTLIRWHNTHAPFSPVLSEESEGSQGYSNPYAIQTSSDGVEVSFRLRDFDIPDLRAREAHVRAAAGQLGLPIEAVRIHSQYEDMGPGLAPFPELIEWPRRAAEAMGREISVQPIRGGTGVDPFLAKGIPVANVGTGYFAPESEKEITSRQNLARHALWLVNLVQAVVENGGATAKAAA